MGIQNRPELADNRRGIYNETTAVLNGVQVSSYAPLENLFINEILSSVGATTAVSDLPFPYLTGALQAAVPLIITIPSKNNKFLSFTMLINPESWNHSKTSSIQSSYTRDGYVTQLWGPSQDLITSNGKTAAFMVEGIGLTNSARKRSFSYSNFLALLYSYRNNGYILSDFTKNVNELTRVIDKVTGIEIFYDYQNYMGHFNNFTIDDSADTPFLLNYNFEFVISTLSTNYNEVRGHFTPIGGAFVNDDSSISEEYPEPRILGDLA